MSIKLYYGDCLFWLRTIQDKSVDLCLTDPPYGTTACKWDVIVPFDPMWEQLKRIVKERGAICLFGIEPFSSYLRLSNIKMFKYDWIWKKNKYAGFVNAKLKPLKSYEICSVFSLGKTANNNRNNMFYFPQGLKPFNKRERSANKKNQENTYWRPSLKSANSDEGYIREKCNYPQDIINFSTDNQKQHPTQKPVALLEYLIKTYTLEGETVLDFTMGSGSTGVACKNLNRNFIGIEKILKYYQIAEKRINNFNQ